MKNLVEIGPTKYHTFSLTDKIGSGVRQNHFFFRFRRTMKSHSDVIYQITYKILTGLPIKSHPMEHRHGPKRSFFLHSILT